MTKKRGNAAGSGTKPKQPDAKPSPSVPDDARTEPESGTNPEQIRNGAGTAPESDRNATGTAPEPSPSVPDDARTAPEPASRMVTDPEQIPKFRQCPQCWGRFGGVGVVQSTKQSTRYYKCVRSVKIPGQACGWTWTATVKTSVVNVESRGVQLDGQR